MSKLPLIDFLSTEDDYTKIKVYHEDKLYPLADTVRSCILPYFDPAILSRRVYDYDSKEPIIFLSSTKDTNIKGVTEKYIKILKETVKNGFMSKESYYNSIAAYLIYSHTDKMPDKMILAQVNKFNKIPHDIDGYFMCLILSNIFKHGEIHIDIAGEFYWYDIVKEQYYNRTGLVGYPPLTMPITKVNKEYMDVVKCKKQMTVSIRSSEYTIFCEYGKSICELENDKYEGGIML